MSGRIGEVAGIRTQSRHDLYKLAGIGKREPGLREHLIIEGDRRALNELAARLGERQHRGPTVIGVGFAQDVAVAHESIRRIRDARRVHLKPRNNARERQSAQLAKREQPQQLEAGKGKAEGFEGGIHSRQQQLVRAHHRSDDRHSFSGVIPTVREPLPLGFDQRIKWGVGRTRHPFTVVARRRIGPSLVTPPNRRVAEATSRELYI